MSEQVVCGRRRKISKGGGRREKRIVKREERKEKREEREGRREGGEEGKVKREKRGEESPRIGRISAD